jgi:hypothetical protein
LDILTYKGQAGALALRFDPQIVSVKGFFHATSSSQKTSLRTV